MTIILWILGGISTIYFVVYAIVTGLNNVFTYFWLVLGIFLNCVAYLRLLMKNREYKLPAAVSGVIYTLSALCLLIFFITEAVIIAGGMEKPKKGADYIIILGARVNGKNVSSNLCYRLEAALDYINDNPECQVIVSGGKGAGEDITEALAMKNYLLDKGVEGARIIEEDKSVNTDENIKYSLEIIGTKSASIVVVSNNFHVFRAKAIFKKQGCENISSIGSKTMWFTIPNSYVREFFGVLKYKIFGQI